VARRPLQSAVGHFALCDLGNSSNTIDRYNEWKKDETLAGMLETSPTPLPKVNGLCLLGVYKGMLQGQLVAEFKQKPTMPQEILVQIATRQDDNVDTIIDSINRQALEKAGLSTSMIDAARAKRAAQTAEKDRIKTESETSAMIALFKITPMESFSNEHWGALPLWKQYQFLFMAYRQIMSGIGTAMADVERGYKAEEAQDRFDGLVALASEERIELLTAAKSGEVQQAFDEDRLNAELYGIE
jgi:hypothetical protein